MRVHLDTDLGSDTDDVAALAMLLGAHDVELIGVTTSIDPGGRRAGFVAEVLREAGRDEVPVAAGAAVSLTTLVMPGHIPEDAGRWPEPVAPVPSPAGAATRLLADSIDAGATIIVIGPYTNLALLGVERPDVLGRARVVLMGGWFDLSAEGLPPCGPDQDWNVQCDTTAADIVVRCAGDLTVVPLPLTLRVHLRGEQLARLRAAGSLGRLIALQTERHGEEEGNVELGRNHPALPDDLLNFQHDPLACAAALGWPCVTLEERRIVAVHEGDLLRFVDHDEGRSCRLGVDLDPDTFDRMWLAAVEAAHTGDVALKRTTGR